MIFKCIDLFIYIVNPLVEVACRSGLKVLQELLLILYTTNVCYRRGIQYLCHLSCWVIQPSRISSCPSGGRQLLGSREYQLGISSCSKVRIIHNLRLLDQQCFLQWIYKVIIILLSIADIKLKSWQRETVGTTIMFSSVLNLHQPKKQLPEKGNNTFSHSV